MKNPAKHNHRIIKALNCACLEQQPIPHLSPGNGALHLFLIGSVNVIYKYRGALHLGLFSTKALVQVGLARLS